MHAGMSNPGTPRRGGWTLDFSGISNGGVDRRSREGLDSEVLGMHVCYSFLGMVVVWMRHALRRSGVLF